MCSEKELAPNPASDNPPSDMGPKLSIAPWRTALYVMHIVVTVAIAFFAPQPAKIVSIAVWLLTWAIFNTWKKDVSALAGGWASFSIFVITVLASWISSGTMQFAHLQDVRSLQIHFRSIERSLNQYHETRGSYPPSLSHPSFEFPYGNDSGILKDSWERPILYAVEGNGFRLSSFGRDGVPGGVGLDSDWSYHSSDPEYFRNVPEIRLPLRQFLFDTPSTSGILISSVWFFIVSGLTVRSEQAKPITSKRALVVTAIGVTVIGAVVCTFLATFHIAASQSSH